MNNFAKACDVIAAKTGLHFPPDRWAILHRNLELAASAFGFECLEEFTNWLITGILREDHVTKLASFLTVSESYFWREDAVFLAITESVLPGLILTKRDKDKTLRIWSAGCSTGEEAYSLAIAIHRTIPDLKEWKVSILATDINKNSLLKAEAGIYSKWSFRHCPSWLVSGYFNKLENGNFKIKEEIKKMVTFKSLNLTNENFPSFSSNTQSMDIIFCRNVLMYFTEEWKKKITEGFYQSLQERGWFAVASCELCQQNFSDFDTVNFKGAILYRKKVNDSNNPPVIQSFNRTIDPFFSLDSIGIANDIANATYSSNPKLNVSVERLQYGNKSHNKKPTVNNLEGNEAAKIPELIASIRLSAGQGHLEEALTLCNNGIACYKLVKIFYFLKASVLQVLNRQMEAVVALKQVIYLDPDFIMAHFTLGNLYLHQNNQSFAKKHFKNALNLLQESSPDENLPESDGLSVRYIREIIMANMKNL